MRILVVEDSYTQARVHEINLSRHGFDVTRANCLKDGLDAFSLDKKFDAVLLDLNLPDSTGIATFYKMKERASEVPVVIVTSLSDESSAIEALQGGARDYLIKGQSSDAELGKSMLFAVERYKAESRLRECESYRKQIELSTKQLKEELELLANKYKGKLDADGDDSFEKIMDGIDRMLKLSQGE